MQCKAKLRYLEDLACQQTCIIALCETFFSDKIFDSEIYMEGYLYFRELTEYLGLVADYACTSRKV